MKQSRHSKASLPRIYFIDRKIAPGAYLNTSEPAEEYETSRAAIGSFFPGKPVPINCCLIRE